MNVSLSPELEEFITTRVASGRYRSASEVIGDGLRLLEEREAARMAALWELRQKIGVGLDQIARSEVHDGEATFREIHELSQRRSGGAA